MGQHIFISYDHDDKDCVDALVRGLKNANLPVWRDLENLSAAESWEQQINSALEQASTIVVVWSTNALASKEVRAEAYFAMATGKAFPIRIEDVRLSYRWEPLQRVDLLERPVDASPNWQRLLDDLRRHVSDERPPASAGAESGEPVRMAERQGDIVIPAHLVAPAGLVLMTVMSALVISALGIESRWAALAPGALGAAGLLTAFLSFGARPGRGWA